MIGGNDCNDFGVIEVARNERLFKFMHFFTVVIIQLPYFLLSKMIQRILVQVVTAEDIVQFMYFPSLRHFFAIEGTRAKMPRDYLKLVLRTAAQYIRHLTKQK